MEKLSNYITETFLFDEDFFVDIVDDGETYSAFLYCVRYGIKDHILGAPKSQQTKSDFIKIVEMALLNDNYIADYMDHFMD